jgi:hypothetical protein
LPVDPLHALMPLGRGMLAECNRATTDSGDQDRQA